VQFISKVLQMEVACYRVCSPTRKSERNLFWEEPASKPTSKGRYKTRNGTGSNLALIIHVQTAAPAKKRASEFIWKAILWLGLQQAEWESFWGNWASCYDSIRLGYLWFHSQNKFATMWTTRRTQQYRHSGDADNTITRQSG